MNPYEVLFYDENQLETAPNLETILIFHWHFTDILIHQRHYHSSVFTLPLDLRSKSAPWAQGVVLEISNYISEIPGAPAVPLRLCSHLAQFPSENTILQLDSSV